jgi:hypothetical protein
MVPPLAWSDAWFLTWWLIELLGGLLSSSSFAFFESTLLYLAANLCYLGLLDCTDPMDRALNSTV